jgi:selenium-dependent xanthine dehydrogenase
MILRAFYMERIEFWVNRKFVAVDVAPGDMLADVLRERLGLIGTKIGCNEMECGTCTVLVDGEAVLSCNFPAHRVQGRKVLTIEGVAENGVLHPLQEAFIKFGVVQCGFCIPGQIMTAMALLESNPDPDEETIRNALKDTLCRCGGYPSILRAVQAAARAIRTGEPIPTPEWLSSLDTKYVGQMVVRPDAMEKVIGSARFTDDYSFLGMLHGRVLRAGVPYAVLRRLDVRKAQTLDGVIAVLTAEDIPGENAHGVVIHDWPVLVGVGEKVRYVGDALAIVAAETRSIASKALTLIEVEFEELPPVTDPIRARDEESPLVYDDGNLLEHIKVYKGDVEKGFAEADVIIEETYRTSITEHAFLEPECSIARPVEGGRIEVYVGSQIPYADRDQIARCLNLEVDKIRVIGTLIGGGFGGKEDIAGQIHAALLAQVTQRPVKILFDRHESLQTHPKRHATQIRVKLGARKDGVLTAAETELYGDTGAYASLGPKVMARATTHSTGPYVIPHVKADCYAMYTNNPPAGAFRGFGVTQSAYAIESIIDRLSEELAMDAIDLRRKNALYVGATTNTGQLLSESVGLKECIDRVEAELGRRCDGYDPFASCIVKGAPHLRQAWGVAAAYKNTGLGGGAPDRGTAEVELYPDGNVEVRISSAEIGQGLVTVLQLIAAEELSVPLNNVRVLLSDTDLTPDGGPTTASRQTYVAGNAVRGAAGILLQAMVTTVAEKYDRPPEDIRFVEGLAQVDGQAISFADVAGFMKAEGMDPKARYEYWAPETQPLGEGGDMHFAYSFAFQAAQVEVNMETGEVRVLKVIAANDVGRAINPSGLLGQVEGGVMMGLGNTLTEEFIVEGGRIFSDRLARYRVPSIVAAPEIFSIVVESPTGDGPYGAKGVGELSSIPTTPAITNAIYNACGVHIKSLPVDQDWLAQQLRTRKGESR